LILLGLALLLAAQDGEAALRARVAAQPAPVRRYVERRAMCNHWGGEEPYDAARRREIARAVRALRCTRIDRDEAVLRRRHAGRPATIAVIDEAAELLGW
jgi:hypothetical protein